MRGEQAHRGTAQVRLAHRIGGDLLAFDLRQESGQPPGSGDLLAARGHIEQRADRVQVPVGPPPGIAGPGGVAPQPVGPGRTGPQVPQGLLRRLTALDAAVATPEQVGQRTGGIDFGPLAALIQPVRVAQRQAGQLGGRAGRAVPASSARSASRRARPSRRTAMLSMPPSGEVSSSWASSGVTAQPRAAT